MNFSGRRVGLKLHDTMVAGGHLLHGWVMFHAPLANEKMCACASSQSHPQAPLGVAEKGSRPNGMKEVESWNLRAVWGPPPL